MIYYNNYSAWTKVYLGSTEFAKVYSSDAQVFPTTPPTPPTPSSNTAITYYASEKLDIFESLKYNNFTPKPTGETFSNGVGIIEFAEDVTSLDQYCLEGEMMTYINIPDSVTSIGGWAFNGCSGLTSVTIGSGVTTIGQLAFYNCYSLTSVTIPNGVSAINNATFGYCSGMTNVSIPNSVTSIGTQAFRYCTSLTGINIPNSVTTIDDNAFQGCTSLTSLSIPNSVTTIDDNAFNGCSGLTSVTIGSGVTTIGRYAFSYGTSLTSVTCLATTPPTLGQGAFYQTNQCHLYVPCNSLSAYKSATNWSQYADRIQAIEGTCADEKVTITFTSSTVSSVTCDQYTVGTLTTGDTSFNGGASTRGKIDSAIVGDCVNTIDGAFANAYLMTAVTLPSTITTIGTSAFSQCYILQSINLQDCSGLTTIGNSAFANCSGMTNVSIPNSVTSLGDSAFVNCSGLTSITLPNSISRIGEMTFYKCYSLASANIPSATTSIGRRAFQNCRNLSSVVIPSGVTSIDTEAFNQCSGLTSVTCLATTPPTLASNVFYQTNQCPIYVPTQAVEAYKTATNWWDYASRIQAIPNS